MKIGQLSVATDCKVETIRYYEKIGLLQAPSRSDSGYRLYDQVHLQRLQFIRRLRELGFSIDEIRTLLSLVDKRAYSCDTVKDIMMTHVADIRKKIRDLKQLEKTLNGIASQCVGGESPDCGIIDQLYFKTLK